MELKKMRCENCGSMLDLADGVLFCSHCGEKIILDDEAQNINITSMKYFSRSVEDTMAAVKTFQEKGVSLNCNAEHFDSFHIEIVENLEFIKQLDLGFDDMDDIEEPDSGMIMQ